MQYEKVITYASRKLKVHENNYPTQDLELAVMFFTLKIFRHYLYGIHVYVLNNNNNNRLQYVFTQKELNLWQLWWLELLKYYDMSILNHPGKANVFVDSLSHMTMVSVSHVEKGKKYLV